MPGPSTHLKACYRVMFHRADVLICLGCVVKRSLLWGGRCDCRDSVCNMLPLASMPRCFHQVGPRATKTPT